MIRVAILSYVHGADIEYRTRGETVAFWLEGKIVSGDLPRSWKRGRKDPMKNKYKSEEDNNYTTEWEEENGNCMQSPMPLRRFDVGRWR